jgi:hypothetical protein
VRHAGRCPSAAHDFSLPCYPFVEELWPQFGTEAVCRLTGAFRPGSESAAWPPAGLDGPAEQFCSGITHSNGVRARVFWAVTTQASIRRHVDENNKNQIAPTSRPAQKGGTARAKDDVGPNLALLARQRLPPPHYFQPCGRHNQPARPGQPAPRSHCLGGATVNLKAGYGGCPGPPWPERHAFTARAMAQQCNSS